MIKKNFRIKKWNINYIFEERCNLCGTRDYKIKFKHVDSYNELICERCFIFLQKAERCIYCGDLTGNKFPVLCDNCIERGLTPCNYCGDLTEYDYCSHACEQFDNV